MTEALTAFVLKPSSCTAESRHSVGLNRFPKRECCSSWHTGALTPHQWSFGLKYLFFYPARSKLCWFWAKDTAVENSDAYPSMLEVQKQWLPYVCPDFLPNSQMEMQLLCYVSRVSPLNPRKTYFGPLRSLIPPEVLMCAHKTHTCLFIQAGRGQQPFLGYEGLRSWTSVQESRKEASNMWKNVIWKERSKWLVAHEPKRGHFGELLVQYLPLSSRKGRIYQFFALLVLLGWHEKAECDGAAFSSAHLSRTTAAPSAPALAPVKAFFNLNRISKDVKLSGSLLLLESFWR